jgi:hypothetical protein
MAIDAIVANMDSVWTAGGRDTKQSAHVHDASLKRFLQTMRDDGYPLALVSDLDAARLNDAIADKLGDEGVTYFSSILSSGASESRYAMALHTLATPAHRVVAVSAGEGGFEEARSSGITQCVALRDALRHASAPFSRAHSYDR